MSLAQTSSKFNTAGLENSAGATRREFLHHGAELSNRGQQPVAQFVSELADLEPHVVAEIRARLEAYTRFDAATYAALGAECSHAIFSRTSGRQKMTFRRIDNIIAELLLKLATRHIAQMRDDGEFHTAISAKRGAHPGQIPVVAVDTFKSVTMKNGAAYAPVFNIIGWVDRCPELLDAAIEVPTGGATGANELDDDIPWTP